MRQPRGWRAPVQARPDGNVRRARGILALCLVAVALWPITALSADRTIDGTANNLANPSWGAASDTSSGFYVHLVRVGTAAYGDGISTPAGATRPSAREVSNGLSAQSGSLLNNRDLTDYVWQWGQFVDHDIDLTEGASPAEAFNIDVPAGDSFFDPGNTGSQVIPLNRSIYDPGTGVVTPREQINEITSYIDASNVYGSDPVRAAALRTGGGTGAKLLTSGTDLLPLNTALLPNANGGPFPDAQLYLAGDVRANEQIGLTAMHTLFVREHNLLVDELISQSLGLNDEQLYQRARKIVGAQMQAITYNEFLPALLGASPLTTYSGYDSLVDATISNEFSTATYRLGHSMLSTTLRRVENDGSTAAGGHLDLQDAFFDPTNLASSADLEQLLKGLGSRRMQEVDTLVIDDVRNFLFGPPGAGGFDLASLNIQRGRDHGLPDYNAMRQAYGLSAITSFADITSDTSLEQALRDVYGQTLGADNVDSVDAWVGALAEDQLAGTSVGELTFWSLVDQFERLRDGDRFWYEIDSDFTSAEIADLQATRLSDIILRNTSITNIRENVFVIPEPSSAMLLAVGVLAWCVTLGGRSRRPS